MTKRRLFLVRHSVRGFPDTVPPVSADPSALQILASGENLNINGHILCYKMGKYFKKNYGKPDFVYGDVTDPRTIDSSISFGRGVDINHIHLSRTSPDLFFNTPKTITPETIKVEHEILARDQEEIARIKRACDQIPSLNLVDFTTIDPITGDVHGLVQQEYVLGSIMLFDETCKIRSPLLKKRETIMQIHPIIWTLRTPTLASIQDPVMVMLTGISYLLQQYKLSVLFGHEHNVIQIARFLGLGYEIPGFSNLWIQPNSGFIFTLSEDKIKMKMFYLDRDLNFRTQKYAKISLPTPINQFDMVKKTIN